MSIQSDCRTLAEEILKDDLRQLKDCISTLRAERDAARATSRSSGCGRGRSMHEKRTRSEAAYDTNEVTPTLYQLLSARPKAVEAIENDYNASLSLTDEENACRLIRSYCASEQIGSPWLDSIETLLDLIESRCVADAPLSDAEIEGMKWRVNVPGGLVIRCGELFYSAGSPENANYLITEQNNGISTLHREIKRLRNNKEAH